MSSLPNTYITPEEYLDVERRAEYKSEYYDGQMFAMSGGSMRHITLTGQLWSMFRTHVRGRNCSVYFSDLRVLVNPGGLYTYPDVVVICGEAKLIDAVPDTVENPVLIVEVLSPTTEAYDRGKKARLYRGMASLSEYLLVAQDNYEVELHRKQADGTWNTIDANGLDASIELASIGYTLHLRDLYEGIIGG